MRQTTVETGRDRLDDIKRPTEMMMQGLTTCAVLLLHHRGFMSQVRSLQCLQLLIVMSITSECITKAHKSPYILVDIAVIMDCQQVAQVNDYVGSDASAGHIPGVEKARTNHQNTRPCLLQCCVHEIVAGLVTSRDQVNYVGKSGSTPRRS